MSMLTSMGAGSWGVRDWEGNIHHGISQGDAENLEAQTGWELVRHNGQSWEPANV